jgi:hypothetical protein
MAESEVAPRSWPTKRAKLVSWAEDSLSWGDEEAAELKRLLVRPDSVFEVETAFLPAASFLDESGRTQTPLAVIMSDRASYFVLAMELAPGDGPLRDPLRTVLFNGMTEHQAIPERIHVCNESLRQVLQRACDQLGIDLERVEKLDAAPDALEALAQHLRDNRSK